MNFASSPARAAVLRYDPLTVTFHWVVLLLVVTVGTLGLLHDSWSRGTQSFWINLHAVLGILLLALVITRLGWRLSHRPPPLPREAGAFSRRLAAPVHWLLYLLLLVIPVLGIVTFVWHGRAFDFGLFQVNFGVKKNRAIFHPTEDVHGYLAYALFTLAALHALAALWHHYVRRDGVLRRMWPAGEED
jgi:cytochrome b561